MRFLMDEHVPPAFRVQLLLLLPDTDIRQIGQMGALPLGTPDPDILVWCETHDFILVTNNRKSMPVHLTDHLNAGRHIPGILTINLTESIGKLVQELKEIAELSFENEYKDRIVYVPLKR